MTTSRQALRQRITSGPTFWFAGAQDALSARLVDQSAFDGVFTTGFGISASLLGQPDMELYTLSENVQVVRNVTAVVDKPVFADADTGYGNVLNVVRTVREFERAGVAALSIEDQISPKRCPAAAKHSLVVSLADAVARIKAAVDTRRDPDLLIVARTDAEDPGEAIERATRYAEAGADLIQPISRTFNRLEQLQELQRACGRRLSLQLMAGTWMSTLSRSDIEGLAAFATYPLTTLMSSVYALQSNLQALAERRSGDAGSLPCHQVSMAEFKQVIGWQTLEAQQARYEVDADH